MVIKSYPWAQAGGGQQEAQTYLLEREMWERLYDHDGILAGSRYKLAGSGTIADKSLLVEATSPTPDLNSNVNLGVYMLGGAQARVTQVEVVPHTQNLSGNPRIDVVYLRRDDSSQEFDIIVSEGTPAASPVPTLLSDTATLFYAELARITLPSGGNISDSNIVNVRRYARPAGQISAGAMHMRGDTPSELAEDEVSCDGSLLDRDAYPDLFSAIGTLYNTGGEAATEFRIPDMRGKVPGGSNDAGLANGADGSYTTRNEGDSAGTEDHTLTEAELASHQHGSDNRISTGTTNRIDVWVSGTGWKTSQMSTIGSDTAHNNIQPTLFVHMVLKV